MTSSILRVSKSLLIGGLLTLAGGAWAESEADSLGTNQSSSGAAGARSGPGEGAQGKDMQDPACLPDSTGTVKPDCAGSGGSTNSGSGEDERGTSSGTGSTGGGGTAPGMTTPGAPPHN